MVPEIDEYNFNLYRPYLITSVPIPCKQLKNQEGTYRGNPHLGPLQINIICKNLIEYLRIF